MSTAEEEDRLAAEAAGLTAEQQAALTAYHSEANFLLLHRPQFESMRLPKQLWPVVYRKIYTETDDAGDAFVIAQEETEEDEEDDSDGEAAAGFHLVVQREDGLKAGEDVWVLQHAWSAREQEAVQQLTREPAVVERLWAMMDLDTRLKREERKEERRKLAEVEARQRREDRKEPADAEEERRRKEAEEEKQRDREQRQQQQAEAEREAAADYSDDESIALLMTQTGASREQAVQALSNSSGDVIEAINALNINDIAASITAAAATPAHTAAAASASSSSSSSSSSTSSPLSLSSLSDDERRAKTVWDALFRYGYVHCYYTAQPREDRRELRAEDVQTVLYCNDEVGSAVAAGLNPNAELRPLYVVTLNTAVSLLWLTRDAEQGTELHRPVRPLLRKTREWSR